MRRNASVALVIALVVEVLFTAWVFVFGRYEVPPEVSQGHTFAKWLTGCYMAMHAPFANFFGGMPEVVSALGLFVAGASEVFLPVLLIVSVVRAVKRPTL